jgi:hypothetical protein
MECSTAVPIFPSGLKHASKASSGETVAPSESISCLSFPVPADYFLRITAWSNLWFAPHQCWRRGALLCRTD